MWLYVCRSVQTVVLLLLLLLLLLLPLLLLLLFNELRLHLETIPIAQSETCDYIHLDAIKEFR